MNYGCNTPAQNISTDPICVDVGVEPNTIAMFSICPSIHGVYTAILEMMGVQLGTERGGRCCSLSHQIDRLARSTVSSSDTD